VIFNIPLRRKDTEVDAVPCTVEKSVTLSAEEFAHFSQNLMSDYDFIRENIDRMYQDENGVKHCLLVLGEGCADGILVESEGSTYARYSAFVPNARQLLQQYDPTLQSFCDRMQEAMERTVHSAPLHQENGMVRIPLSTLAPAPGEYPLDVALLSEMLSGQPELQAVELFGDEIVMQIPDTTILWRADGNKDHNNKTGAKGIQPYGLRPVHYHGAEHPNGYPTDICK